MAALSKQEYKVKKFSKHTTMHIDVRITRQMRLRVEVAIRLLRLAAWVLGCGIVINEVEDGG